MKRTKEEIEKAKEQARRELEGRKKVSEEEDFLNKYSSKRIKQDIIFNQRMIEMKYERLEDQDILGVKQIVDNEPFESMYPPIEKEGMLDDSELQKELKKMRDKRDDREKIYKLIDVNVSSDYGMTKFLSLILEGFEALTVDLWTKEEGQVVKEYQEQKAKIEKTKRETPLFKITYQLDPLYELYDKGTAKINVSGRGRRPERATNRFTKEELYDFLHPIFDEEIKSPEEKFKGRNVKDSVDYIQDIFEVFYGEYKDIEAIRKTISKK